MKKLLAICALLAFTAVSQAHHARSGTLGQRMHANAAQRHANASARHEVRSVNIGLRRGTLVLVAPAKVPQPEAKKAK